MYLGWVGNRYYIEKIQGVPTGRLDKCLFGVTISTALLGLLIGPFYLFSTWSPFVTFNPVGSATIKFNLQVNRTVFVNKANGQIYNHLPQNLN